MKNITLIAALLLSCTASAQNYVKRTELSFKKTIKQYELLKDKGMKVDMSTAEFYLKEIKQHDKSGKIDIVEYEELLNSYKNYNDSIDSVHYYKNSVAMNLEIKDISQFNRIVIETLPDYKIHRLSDLISGCCYNCTLKNKDDEITIHYRLDVINANPNLKIIGDSILSRIEITGQYMAVIDLYNRIFMLNIPYTDYSEKMDIYNPIRNGGSFTNSHLSRLPRPEGYWKLTLSSVKR